MLLPHTPSDFNSHFCVPMFLCVFVSASLARTYLARRGVKHGDGGRRGAAGGLLVLEFGRLHGVHLREIQRAGREKDTEGGREGSERERERERERESKEREGES